MKFISNGHQIDLDAGKRLRKWSKDNGISIRKISIMAGVSQGLLSDVVNGRKSLSLETAAKIAQVCGIDFIWLLTGVSVEKKA